VPQRVVHRDLATGGMALRGVWTMVVRPLTVSHMGSRRLDTKQVGLVATSLLLIGAVMVWMSGRAWTDHDVSNPGVTL
jgi:hypothetical protein